MLISFYFLGKAICRYLAFTSVLTNHYPVCLQNLLISSGLEPILSHSEKLCIAMRRITNYLPGIKTPLKFESLYFKLLINPGKS